MDKMTFENKAILAFCRLGVAGLAPKAPGTWGTALACVLAPLLFFPLDYLGRSVLLVVLFIAGGLAATRAEKILGKKDPGQVVIDELVGLWIVFFPFIRPGFWLIFACFLFFRLFDITKPWPVHASENWLPDGFGIMIDDVFAGLWALLCVGALCWLGILP